MRRSARDIIASIGSCVNATLCHFVLSNPVGGVYIARMSLLVKNGEIVNVRGKVALRGGKFVGLA
jgi:hypothetical protein